jgi:hypothetical protein
VFKSVFQDRMQSSGFFGLRDHLGLAAGTNLTAFGGAMLHSNEAVLPSRFNPSSPVFDPMAFWQPALAALGGGFGGGGGTTILLMDSGGGLSEAGEGDLSPRARRGLHKSLRALERDGYVKKGTVLR